MPMSGDYSYVLLVDNTVEIESYSGPGGNITIPTTLEGYNVTSIGYLAFSYCTSLTSVTIQSSVTSIGNYAFYSCTSLTSVTIPSSATSIGYFAFSYCTSLTSINIPDSVSSIGDFVFSYCTSLTSIVVDIGNPTYSSLEGVLYNKLQATLVCYPIGKTGAFTIPNCVTSIGTGAFSYCTSLTSVTIPNSVTSIGNSAFYLCTSLTSVNIPSSVTSIGGSAFFSCTSLTSVTIPSSVTSIGISALQSCTGLASVNIPSSVTSIGSSAFSDCNNLVAAKFFGDAPMMGIDVFIHVPGNFKIYYLYGKSGFTNPPIAYTMEPFYMLTYAGNGNISGTAPVDSSTYLDNETATVLDNTGSLKKVGYIFGGWNTQADGNGTHYDSGATFAAGNQNVILYAQWKFSQLLISSTLITTVLN